MILMPLIETTDNLAFLCLGVRFLVYLFISNLIC